MPGGFSVTSLHLVVLALLCAVLSYALIRVLMPVFRRYALARPNARSSHSVPTPQGGGVAVVLATLAGVFAVAVALPETELWSRAMAMLALATMLLAATGALDDLRPLPVMPRLAVQILAAGCGALLLTANGPTTMFGAASWPVVLIAAIGLIWFINLTNFMDGIDGITVAEFVPMTVALAMLSVSGLTSPTSGCIAAALCGGLVGFAPYNRHVAKLFLGDVGSLAIGFIAGCLLLRLALDGHLSSALILPMYYLADATLTLLRRFLRGERITEAHRSHFYQRATDLGWRAPEITGLILRVNIALCLLAVATAFYDSAAVQMTAVISALALTAWLLRQLSQAARR